MAHFVKSYQILTYAVQFTCSVIDVPRIVVLISRFSHASWSWSADSCCGVYEFVVIVRLTNHDNTFVKHSSV